MEVISLEIPEVKLIKPKIYGDTRGFFLETYQKQRYLEAGIPNDFVQDNLSKSAKGVLRGLHIQNPKSQGKLVSVIAGEVFDVAVDVRIGSPTFGQSIGYYLNEENKCQLWVPRGFAHGFVVTSDEAIFSYKCDEYYAPEHEVSLAWNDKSLGIQWPCDNPLLSSKDQTGIALKDFDDKQLPHYGV